MCGGLVAAYSLRLGGTDGVMGGGGLHASIIWPHLFYNSGRLITYTLLGGIMGLIGSFIAASDELMGIQGLASIVAGSFTILMRLSLGRWIPYTALLHPAWVSQFTRLSRAGEQFAARTQKLGTLPLGLLLGFMPCGPLYAMEINAAGTGRVGMGMLTLLAFGLGTVPTLFTFGLASTLIGHHLPRRLFQAAARGCRSRGADATARPGYEWSDSPRRHLVI